MVHNIKIKINKGFTPPLFKKEGGFTLVEVIVTVFVFSLVISTAMGLFASIIKLQRYNLAQQQLLNQTGYAMEYVSRAIRMAQKNSSGICAGMANKNYESTGDNIRFVTYNNECWRFFKEGTTLKINKNGVEYPLISNNFTVTSLQFIVAGDAPEDGLQPKVTVLMGAQGAGSGQQPQITIQTTISQRNLDL